MKTSKNAGAELDQIEGGIIRIPNETSKPPARGTRSRNASAEIDMVEAQSGVIRIPDAGDESSASRQDGGLNRKVTRTGDTPWFLVDGIKWGEERLIYAPDGAPACQIRLRAPRGVDGDPFTNNRVLARYLPDGAIREIMIDFTPPYLESQEPAGTVLPEKVKCERCEMVKAALDS
jgi:hypothetical protein